MNPRRRQDDKGNRTERIINGQLWFIVERTPTNDVTITLSGAFSPLTDANVEDIARRLATIDL